MRIHFQPKWRIERLTLCEYMPESPGEFYKYWNGLYLGFIVFTWHTKGKQLSR